MELPDSFVTTEHEEGSGGSSHEDLRSAMDEYTSLPALQVDSPSTSTAAAQQQQQALALTRNPPSSGALSLPFLSNSNNGSMPAFSAFSAAPAGSLYGQYAAGSAPSSSLAALTGGTTSSSAVAPFHHPPVPIRTNQPSKAVSRSIPAFLNKLFMCVRRVCVCVYTAG